MPPLPDYAAEGPYGRPDMSAPPVARTRGIRGPVSGPRQGGAGNGAPTRNRLPDWANQDGDPSRGYGRDE